MSQEKIKNIIEAALMVSTKPFSVSRLLDLFEGEQTLQPERNDIRAAIEALQQDYQDRGIELVEVASGFRFHARDEYALWVNHLFDERAPRYSRALLETLAIIAYRQPITRGEIEEIRGVSVSSTIIKTLQEREWLKVVGHRDVPGKPALFTTTKSFLDYFNLKNLSDLPALADIMDLDGINSDLFEGLEGEAKAKANAETKTATESADNSELVWNDPDTETQILDTVSKGENESKTSDSSEPESESTADIDKAELETVTDYHEKPEADEESATNSNEDECQRSTVISFAT